ncbi:hypothetical protein [Streptomyces sp. NPDC093094]|uniref:hypothetical protein n=1 Tax=Streptomyces sp. NPDC093094 TaxID=3366026 RepID=UPI0038303B40
MLRQGRSVRDGSDGVRRELIKKEPAGTRARQTEGTAPSWKVSPHYAEDPAAEGG